MNHVENLKSEAYHLDNEFPVGTNRINEEFEYNRVTYLVDGSLTVKEFYMGDSDGESIYDYSWTWNDLKLSYLNDIGDPINLELSIDEIENLIF